MQEECEFFRPPDQQTSESIIRSCQDHVDLVISAEKMQRRGALLDFNSKLEGQQAAIEQASQRQGELEGMVTCLRAEVHRLGAKVSGLMEGEVQASVGSLREQIDSCREESNAQASRSEELQSMQQAMLESFQELGRGIQEITASLVASEQNMKQELEQTRQDLELADSHLCNQILQALQESTVQLAENMVKEREDRRHEISVLSSRIAEGAAEAGRPHEAEPESLSVSEVTSALQMSLEEIKVEVGALKEVGDLLLLDFQERVESAGEAKAAVAAFEDPTSTVASTAVPSESSGKATPSMRRYQRNPLTVNPFDKPPQTNMLSTRASACVEEPSVRSAQPWLRAPTPQHSTKGSSMRGTSPLPVRSPAGSVKVAPAHKMAVVDLGADRVSLGMQQTPSQGNQVVCMAATPGVVRSKSPIHRSAGPLVNSVPATWEQPVGGSFVATPMAIPSGVLAGSFVAQAPLPLGVSSGTQLRPLAIAALTPMRSPQQSTRG